MASTSPQISIDSQLTREQAEMIVAQGNEAAIFALLQFAKQLAEAEAKLNPSATPSTPSGMIPTYHKPPAQDRRKKKPGAKPSHPGSRHSKPKHIDEYIVHRAETCPDCEGPLNECRETRTRVIEGIPETKPVATEHTIHRDWCPQGADSQAVLMSVFRTLKQRGHDPISTVVKAIEQQIITGQLPALPTKVTSDG